MPAITTPAALRAPIMRHNQRLDYEALLQEAVAAIEQSGKTRAEIARELNKDRSSITRATKEAGPKLAQLQRDIIALLTEYRIEEDVQFRAVRKES